MFTLNGMKFYGNPDVPNMVWAYPADGSDDEIIPESYSLLSRSGYNAIRAIQEAENAPTPEQLLVEANTKRDRILSEAGLRIAPLQDAIDLGDATEEDKSNLMLWKRYRVAVNRVIEQPDFPTEISWPVEPT